MTPVSKLKVEGGIKSETKYYNIHNDTTRDMPRDRHRDYSQMKSIKDAKETYGFLHIPNNDFQYHPTL
jgi:hypothetical protein